MTGEILSENQSDGQHRSRFGGLWTDRIGSEHEVASRLADGLIGKEDAARLLFFIEHGYVVIKNAVDYATIDSLLEEINRIPMTTRKYVAGSNNESCFAEAVFDNPAYRVLDVHVNSVFARKVMFAKEILRFLEIIFEADALAFQTLLFRYGSQQGVHQDGAYVVVDPPLNFAASWVALEDVVEGAGELIYYAGSHKNEEFIFGNNRKHFQINVDGIPAHDAFLGHLEAQAEKHNQPRTTFLANKGDALIWAADLAHGGTVATKSPQPTRLSLVTHYCPVDARPSYFDLDDFNSIILAEDGGKYASSWYDLRPRAELDTPVRKVDKEYFALKVNGVKAEIGSRINETSVNMHPEFLEIISDTDPAVELVLPVSLKNLQIEVTVESEKNETLQVFYLNDAGGYDEANSLTHPTTKGLTRVHLNWDGDHSVDRIRIDPGFEGGRYLLRDISIFGDK